MLNFLFSFITATFTILFYEFAHHRHRLLRSSRRFGRSILTAIFMIQQRSEMELLYQARRCCGCATYITPQRTSHFLDSKQS